MRSLACRVFAFSSALAVSSAAASQEARPDAAGAPPGVAVEVPVSGDVMELGNESFAAREAASAKLWNLGTRAIPALREAAAGDDPEIAFRARDILLKLDLGILPGTDPAVIRLIDRYKGADTGEKNDLLEELMKKKAFRPLLRLFARETDPRVIDPWQRPARALSLRIARESLLADDPVGAREILELFRKDDDGLLSLAAFHRGQGTLDEELRRVEKASDKKDAAWRLALLRAAGDAGNAYDVALDAGRPELAGSMAMLRGDPLPWLRFGPAFSRIVGGMDIYTPLAIKRWEGKALDEDDFAGISKRLKSKDHANRVQAVFAAILLGEPRMAEGPLAKLQLWAVVKSMDMTERVDDALKLLELDPAEPDFDKWVALRFKKPKDPDAQPDGRRNDLVMMAEFLESRGLMTEQASAFDQRLAALAEKDDSEFTATLGAMCESVSGVVGPALRVGTVWAGDDDKRWEDLLVEIFGDNEDIMPAWAFLGEVDPAAPRKERFAGLLALSNLGPDPDDLYGRWIGACWKHIEGLDAAKRDEPLLRMEYLLGLGGDVANHLKFRDLRPLEKAAAPEPDEEERDEPGPEDLDALLPELDAANDSTLAGKLAHELLYLSAAGRWQDAAGVALELLNRKGAESRGRPDLHAYAASCLRRAGREEDAARHDRWVEILALGESAAYQRIALGYAFGADYARSAVWWRRMVFETGPDSSLFALGLFEHARILLENGSWREAAAASEVMAHVCSQLRYAGAASTTSVLQFRQQADLAHALSLLEEDRPRAVAMLERSHGLVPCDGSLADYFFPAVRKAGLIEEHDRWFALTWKAMLAAVEKYPHSATTRNTAAWLASRAGRELDAAEELLKEALRVHPRQGAYLDTMADLQFAKGKREEALKWAERAVNHMPTDSAIRRQFHRFHTAPLPGGGDRR